MIARLLAALLALALASCATISVQQSPARTIEWTALVVPGIPDEHVTVWLPPGYDSNPARRYPVLYMWDGQNLFDPAKTHYGKAWMVQDVLAGLVASGKAEPHIVVGIWSPPGLDRYRVYAAQKLRQRVGDVVGTDMDRMAGGPIASDAMLAWTADGLKARVDREFRTRASAKDTTIVGASMGGLMACYALIERPDVFGRAGCVSSHFALADPELAAQHHPEIEKAWSDYLASRLGRPNGRRVWMDHGTKTLDAYYGPWQDALASDLSANGWVEGRDFAAHTYQGAEHDETFWRQRMPEMLEWLWR
jgi:enterochelin esterase-like enzyme